LFDSPAASFTSKFSHYEEVASQLSALLALLFLFLAFALPECGQMICISPPTDAHPALKSQARPGGAAFVPNRKNRQHARAA
jgi:hypothetical protein